MLPLCALDADTGNDSGPGLYKVRHPHDMQGDAFDQYKSTITGEYIYPSGGSTPMGAILLSPTKIYLPQGRRNPYVYKRYDGSYLGVIGWPGDGGVFALLTPDPDIRYVQTYGQKSSQHGHSSGVGYAVMEFNAEKPAKDSLAKYTDARHLVISGDVTYVVTGTTLQAVNRSTASTIWSVPCDCPYALIKADNVLFAGGQNKVVAYKATNGQQAWSQSVTGRARGLAVAQQRLLVSTDVGHIYAFGSAFARADFNRDGIISNPDLVSFSEDYLKTP